MANYYRTGRCLTNTSMEREGGRIAGMDISHDNYSEEAYRGYHDYIQPDFTFPSRTEEEK